jgi:acetyl esterase/lipase
MALRHLPACFLRIAPMKILLAVLAVPAVAGLALWGAIAASSALAVFNALVPVDRGVERAAGGEAYGRDPRQKLDVYRPAGEGRVLPVLVFCYGGAWNSGDRALYDFAGRALAAAGFLTIVFDYRLVPDHRFPAFVEDSAAAIAWASRNAARFGGDGGRIFLVGHSAGAYNVALAALDPRYLAAHGLEPRLIAGVAALAGPFDFLPLDGPSTREAFGHWPNLAETQPVNAVTRHAPPFLLITGNADRTVYPRNSKRLAERLKAAGVEARLVILKGLGHADVLTALARPLRWRAPVLEAVTDFFRDLQASAKRS